MSKKLHGKLNLSRIPKNLIVKDKNGESCIYINIFEKKDDKYGYTHSLQIWDKENRRAIYLGDLKEEEFVPASQGQQGRPAAPAAEADDLPF